MPGEGDLAHRVSVRVMRKSNFARHHFRAVLAAFTFLSSLFVYLVFYSLDHSAAISRLPAGSNAHALAGDAFIRMLSPRVKCRLGGCL